MLKPKRPRTEAQRQASKRNWRAYMYWRATNRDYRLGRGPYLDNRLELPKKNSSEEKVVSK